MLILKLHHIPYLTHCTVLHYIVLHIHKMNQLYLSDSWVGDKKKNSQYQRWLQQEFSFYWVNLSVQEDSCIAKTEPDTSSSAVVIYSLKLHQNHNAVKYVTGRWRHWNSHHNTLRHGWCEEAAAADSDAGRKRRGGDVSRNNLCFILKKTPKHPL